MVDRRYAILDRGVLAIEGEEARSFLQGLISNDIEKVGPARAIYAALLTPQGKCLFDFFIAEAEGRLLLDVEAERLPQLAQRLTMYKLRAKVDIADVSADFRVAALMGEDLPGALDLEEAPGSARGDGEGVFFIDPRLSDLGARAVLPKTTAGKKLEALGFVEGSADDYERFRFVKGVPEGAAELGVDKSPLLEIGFDELNGVDFAKGCFVGQELTARMKYRGLVRKRVMPVTFDGAVPSPGAVVKAGGRDIGEIRAAGRQGGFALLRLDKLAEVTERGETLHADDVEITPVKPAWVNF